MTDHSNVRSSGTRLNAAAELRTAEHSEGKASHNKRLKRESLLNNAFELFTEKGITDTTISDIAKKAGVAKGTFYLYFKDKYDLRDRLVRHQAAQILEHAYEAMQNEKAARQDASASAGTADFFDSLEDQVVFLADNIVEQLSNNKILLKFITKNLDWGLLKHDIGSIPTSDITVEGEEEINLTDVLQESFQNSVVKYNNPEILVYMIVEFIGSVCYSSILASDPLPIDQLKPYLLEGVRAIMRSQELPSQN